MQITLKMVGWFLYNLSELRAMDRLEIETSVTANIRHNGDIRGSEVSSKIERAAIQRAAISSVVDALERSIRSMTPEQRTIYRLKYRLGMRHRQIRKRLFLSDRTIERRLAEMKDHVTMYLQAIPEEYIMTFWRYFDD